MGKIVRHVQWIIYVFVVQTCIFSIAVFQVRAPLSTDLAYDATHLRVVPDTENYAYLMEDRQEALAIRLALIEQAQEAIEITSYAIHDGQARDVLYGALLSAAIRGVSVRIVIDGFIEGRFISDYQTTRHMMAHPEIDVGFFEPFSIWRPHAVQNRLHDKLLIVDGQYGIIGGRNIGDRYFITPEQTDAITYDRDVLIFGQPHSEAVHAMQTYFDQLFHHPYTQFEANIQPSEASQATTAQLIEAYEAYVSTQILDFETLVVRLHDTAVKTGAITFLHSPLNRMHKEPVIFNTLKELARDYNRFFVQTPYFIADRPMREHFTAFHEAEVTVLTNSPITNPNIMAAAGYLPIRHQLAATTTLHEYHAQSSIHGKTLLMGDDITVIGSYNIDPRSMSLSTESVVVIHSKTFQTVVEAAIEPLIASSLHVSEAGVTNPHEIELFDDSAVRHIVRTLLRFVLRPFDYML
ncbi:MAG: hypothetical protein EA374_07575 [Acholeplasmatales bacterium]|nr:MAG: hypothetical protein EA374_07575 [Acholeplasmatales bacterium]